MTQTEEERKIRRAEINKKWRENNREKFKNTVNNYRKNNPEKIRAIARKSDYTRRYYNDHDNIIMYVRKLFIIPVEKKKYFRKSEKIDL